MRDVMILNHPVAEPGFCCKCGSQDKNWFVDLGFDTEMTRPNVIEMANADEPFMDLPVWLDGIMYLCCDCVNNLFADIYRKFEEFKKDHFVEVYFNGRTISSDHHGAEQNDSGDESDDSDSDGESNKPVAIIKSFSF